jgi:galactitol-specific phosphotransferase system IIB component
MLQKHLSQKQKAQNQSQQKPKNPQAKRILVVCEEGMNRSHTIKGQIQYWGHDVLTVGLKRNTADTLVMLMKWAELIILTEDIQYGIIEQLLVDPPFLENCAPKTQLWNIGPDNYPRPYNKELLDIVRAYTKENENELKPPKNTQ